MVHVEGKILVGIFGSRMISVKYAKILKRQGGTPKKLLDKQS